MYNAYTHLLIKTRLNIYLFFGPTPVSLGDCNISYKPFVEDLKSTSRQTNKKNTTIKTTTAQKWKEENKVEPFHTKFTAGAGWLSPLQVCFLPSCTVSFVSCS